MLGFLSMDGLDLTNNLAERQSRPGVILRKSNNCNHAKGRSTLSHSSFLIHARIIRFLLFRKKVHLIPSSLTCSPSPILILNHTSSTPGSPIRSAENAQKGTLIPPPLAPLSKCAPHLGRGRGWGWFSPLQMCTSFGEGAPLFRGAGGVTAAAIRFFSLRASNPPIFSPLSKCVLCIWRGAGGEVAGRYSFLFRYAYRITNCLTLLHFML